VTFESNVVAYGMELLLYQRLDGDIGPTMDRGPARLRSEGAQADSPNLFIGQPC
jgi:hypothetical protein